MPLLLGWLFALASAPEASASADSPEPATTESKAAPNYRNTFGIRAAYMHLINHPRESHDPESGEAPTSEDLGGFLLSYERLLYRDWLALELTKPFYFAHDRFDSPFEILLKFQKRFGRVEPFLGVGVTFNVRFFAKEREHIEGTTNSLSFGLASNGGIIVWLSKRWGLELEASYGWIFLGSVVNHEIGTALGPVLLF